MATISDVAKRANVSLATVSFVLNNTKPISEKTRRRVEEAITELGFRPNALARGLASQRTRILALAVPFMHHGLGGTIMEMALAVAQAAQSRGYHLVLWPVGNNKSDIEEFVSQSLVDGVMLMEVLLQDARIPVLQENGVKFSMIGRTEWPADFCYVDVDFDFTVEQAMRHLQSLGHRRIALLTVWAQQAGFENYGPVVRTRAAYKRICGLAGLEPQIHECAPDPDAGRSFARRLVEQESPPTAVILLNERAAFGLVSELQKLGMNVPNDISVMTITSTPQMATIADPPLTMMGSPIDDIGRICVDMLVRQLEGDTVPVNALLPCVLMPGGTTAPAAS